MRMGNTGREGGAGYWLPSEFLTDDDDFLIHNKDNFGNTNTHNYPLDFDSQSSHLLQKFSGMSTSPRSTLPVEDPIYLAAGEAARLRLSRGCEMKPRILPQFVKETKLPIHPNAPIGKIGSRAVTVRGMGHAAWDPYHGGGAAARKACAGTGVFLPRRYHTNSYSSSPRTRPGQPLNQTGCLPPPLQGRSSNAHLRTMTKPLVYSFVESHSHPEIGVAFTSDHNSILARRHALFLMQRRRSFSTAVAECRDHPRLPQEWSY